MCTICEESYDDNVHQAKFLSCHHTFCSHCIKQWHSTKGQDKVGSIQCPNCDQLTDVPDNGVAGLQSNFYIESMKEISKEAEQPKSDQKIKGCQKHENQTVFFYCETCKVAICHNCTVLDHQKTEGHVITGIREATDAHRHTLEDQLLTSHATHSAIQNAMQQVEYQMVTIQGEKDSATENLIAFIRFAQNQLRQCKQEAIDAISQHHVNQQSKLLGEQRQLQQTNGLLEKHISKGDKTIKTGDINDIMSCKVQLEKATQLTKFDIDQIGNCFEADLASDPNLLNDKLHSIGEKCFNSVLPTSVAFRNDEITAGLESVIALELFNGAGNQFPFAPPFLTVKITDPQHEELPATLNTTREECSVTFTPQVSGKHEISVMCLGQKLKSEQTHIMVNSNNPILKFGEHGNGSGTFKFPWGIAMDNNGVLYVADAKNGLIQTFSDNGEFISQFCVNDHDKVCTTLDLALDQANELIYCTDVDNKSQFAARKNMLVFDFEGELQHSYNLNNTISPIFIATNRHHEIIISDTNTGCLCKFDKHGNYLSCMGGLKYPAFTTISEDDTVIVPDHKDDCVCIFNSDGTLRNKFGTSGTGKGQLKQPWAVVTDGENILVSEEGNRRVQVFKYDGRFVSMIESINDPLKAPVGMVVTRDGYVYVVDNKDHCIKKYKYRNVP